MVRAALPHYYTFKITSPEGETLRAECAKWEEGGDIPVEVYKIDTNYRSPMGGCSCPAWTSECKHRRALDEAVADGKAREFWKWIFVEKKTKGKSNLVPEPVDDINPIERFLDG
jgi:hypothetical protein